MQSQQAATSRLIAYLSGDRWNDLIDTWELSDWRRLMGLMLSLAPSNRVRSLCGRLATRMLGAPTTAYAPPAAILAVIGANVDLLVASLDKTKGSAKEDVQVGTRMASEYRPLIDLGLGLGDDCGICGAALGLKEFRLF